jgi:hypothetical protein
MNILILKYGSGEEIKKGDRVRFHGNPAQVEFVACGRNDPEAAWHIEEYGGGVMILDPMVSGRTFIATDQINEYEDLEFVSQLTEPGTRSWCNRLGYNNNRLADGLHATATDLCTGRSQWFGAVPTRRPMIRDAMVEYRIRICLRDSCDSFVFCKHGSKHLLQAATALAHGPQGHHLMVLIIVKHWHFGLAAPAPEHFHRR